MASRILKLTSTLRALPKAGAIQVSLNFIENKRKMMGKIDD